MQSGTKTHWPGIYLQGFIFSKTYWTGNSGFINKWQSQSYSYLHLHAHKSTFVLTDFHLHAQKSTFVSIESLTWGFNICLHILGQWEIPMNDNEMKPAEQTI